MLKDLHFKFPGFHGSHGRCHIRLAKAGINVPLVIVCSQYKNYYGTSITNALEMIAESLFSSIAKKAVEGLAFDFNLPYIRQWDSDVSAFDRLLATLFPNKYGARFTTTTLDVKEIFKRIYWIERYPNGSFEEDFRGYFSVVTLDDSGYPNWRSNVSESEIQSETGFDLQQLFVTETELDLKKIESKPLLTTLTSETIQSIPGYKHVRWTKELIELLPSRLTSTKAEIGGNQSDDLEEKYVHRDISNILSLKLPAGELFCRDYAISKKLGIYIRGREKECDFAIFMPQGGHLYALLEVKRTSSKNSSLKSEVLEDIARLLLCSSKFECRCYLLICGDLTVMKQELKTVLGLISFDETEGGRDRRFYMKGTDFGEYNIASCDWMRPDSRSA